MQILMSRFAMVWDTQGTLIDRRRAKLRPPQGSRLFHVDDGSCRNGRCVDIDHLSPVPLQDPPADPEQDRAWVRAIVTMVRPPANLALPWRATFESATRRGDFPLDEQACKALGIPEGSSAALECEVLLGRRYSDDVFPAGFSPVPADDEWTPNGNGGTAEFKPTGALPPHSPCTCLSGSTFGECHGTPKATWKIAAAAFRS
jgi:hypothetical protein